MKHITCNTLKDINNALQESWMGSLVAATYQGQAYDLFSDTDEKNGNGSHLALMKIVCPEISDSDSTDVQLRKYDSASFALRIS